MITVKQLLEVLLELDQQVISPRPSTWGEAAQLVATLAQHAEKHWSPPTHMWDGKKPAWFGNWRDVDLSSVKQRATDNLSQPVFDELTINHKY